jgi:hypothetical protein
MELSHNSLTNISNGAICVGWGWGATNNMRANNISFNWIVRSNTVLYDAGSIYTLSAQPESEISYNYIENQVRPTFSHTFANNPLFCCVGT